MGEAASVSRKVQEYRGLAADSREVKPGFLFAALAGSKTIARESPVLAKTLTFFLACSFYANR